MNEESFQVRDIWLATFAYESGAKFLGTHRDDRTGYLYWNFETSSMEPVMMSWGAGNPTVDIKKFHARFMYLKGMLGK